MTKFKPVNKLEELLIKAAKKPAAREKFYKELLASEIFVIPLERPAIRNGVAAEGELKLMGYTHDDIFFIAFFTSEERVAEANAIGMGALKLAARDLFKMTAGSCMVLNPNSSLGKEFFPAEIKNMLEGVFETPARHLKLFSKKA